MKEQLNDPMSEFVRLWLRAEGAVSAYVRAAVRDTHDAEDVLQQVATAAAEDFHTFDRERSFVGWVMGIARFRILKYVRRHARDRLVFGASTLEALAEAHVAISPETDDRREALRHCMDGLPARGRKAIEMRYVRPMSPAAIANHIGTSSNAVSSLLHRLRKVLADCITRRLRREDGHE